MWQRRAQSLAFVNTLRADYGLLPSEEDSPRRSTLRLAPALLLEPHDLLKCLPESLERTARSVGLKFAASFHSSAFSPL
jgi:hypothetical protein